MLHAISPQSERSKQGGFLFIIIRNEFTWSNWVLMLSSESAEDARDSKIVDVMAGHVSVWTRLPESWLSRSACRFLLEMNLLKGLRRCTFIQPSFLIVMKINNEKSGDDWIGFNSPVSRPAMCYLSAWRILASDSLLLQHQALQVENLTVLTKICWHQLETLTKSKPLHHSRPERLNEYIGRPAQLLHNFEALWVLEIDSKGAFSSSCDVIIDPASNLCTFNFSSSSMTIAVFSF